MNGNCKTSVIESFGVFKPKTQRITKANKEVLNRDVVYNFCRILIQYHHPLIKLERLNSPSQKCENCIYEHDSKEHN